MSTREKIKSTVVSFPTLPVLTHRLLQVVSNPDADADAIASVIMYDPALTANVLKAANSAYVGCSTPVHSVAEAVLRLGTKWLVHMAISSMVYSNINRPAYGYGLSGTDLWRHSAAVGIVSEYLARTARVHNPGMVFTAGLVHDIGKIAVGQVAEASFEEVVKYASDNELSFVQAETDVLGINHAEAGALVLEHWNFPAGIVEAVRWHHDPDGAAEESAIIDVVHTADALCIMHGIALGRDDLMYQPCETVVERRGFTAVDFEAASSMMLDELEEIEKLFETNEPVSTVRR